MKTLNSKIYFQGFASGSLDQDASSVRLFAARGMEVFVAQSYSKNLGLYAERVGAINVICSSSDVATRCNQMTLLLYLLKFYEGKSQLFVTNNLTNFEHESG